ncbi:peptidoglycan DD-metalloendopeptidase family protein [Deinococcus maricopensis]|uniref:Peptidase M23 n=1 Tax=Deinococcus maricopensis (strain DSM 21211 / LMG 22137 / NRRL B-23946 / LB-34) TaxID=709986 RepID=E8U8S3_DEIML|nr:peptidoglycan DD-metalloendopeptidase family protein [Deinococcus maricopensis]ADV67462.1 Peptidase M23 [Deinococcus maricopensis DSM 21211]
MPKPFRRLFALFTLSLIAHAPAVPLLSPPDLGQAALPLTMQRLQTTPTSGYVYAISERGDRPRDIAEEYGVDPASLGVNPDAPLTAGTVVKFKVSVDADTRLPPGVVTYTVRAGDTLARVARRFDLTTTDLVSANLDTQSLDDLVVGDTLLIPTRETGLLVRVKPGQTALELIRAYRADPVAVARANSIVAPQELRTGDHLLLPGVRADSLMDELLARRARAVENERRQRIQAQYEKYLAYQEAVHERRLREKYARQAQYEKYLAYMNSPERRRAQERYARQAAYEKYLAAQQERQQLAARTAAVASAAPVVRSASSASGTRLAWPMRSFRLTSMFGERDIEFHKEFFHGGIDLAAPYGTPIYAATGGVVREAGPGAFGLNVWTDSGNDTFIYGHMSRTAVRAGQTVEQGQLLGYVGCSGICTGPHLHFEVRVGGRAIDPMGLLP